MAEGDKQYSADDIISLSGLDHVRLRPGMYLGSNDSEGLTTALREAIDNAVDEAIGGYGSTVRIHFYEDGSAEVEDCGRGVPPDANADGISGIELCVGRTNSGGKFNTSQYKQSGGLNGVGVAATNACSTRFDVVVYRDGKRYSLSFRQGHPGHFATWGRENSKFTETHEVKVERDTRPADERRRRPTGTTIRFWPDHSVFLEDSKFDIEDIRHRMQGTAYLVPNLVIEVTDETERTADGEFRHDTFESTGGLADMLPTLTNEQLLVPPITMHGEGTYIQQANVVHMVDGEQRVDVEDVERKVIVDVAMSYTTGDDPIVNSYVNIIQTRDGGTHVDGLWQALGRCMRNYIKQTKGLLKKSDETPTLDDIKAGFVGLISVKVPEPTFSGQAKSALKTPQVTKIVSDEIGKELDAWLNSRKNDKAAKLLAKRVVETTRERVEQKRMKETMRKKASLDNASTRPSKLVECREPGSPLSELYICEGDSALATIKAARDSTYQAVFPIRGKILNVYKADLKKMLANAECTGIISSLGVNSGRESSTEGTRYSSIFIAVDADDDGMHIRTLLLAFIQKYLRAFITEGRVYALEPPLFLNKVTGRNPRTVATIDNQEQEAFLAEVEKNGEKVTNISRFKGLGEVDADTFWTYCLNRETRRVRRVTEGEATEAAAMIELTLGNSVERRKEWLFSGADNEHLRRDELDL